MQPTKRMIIKSANKYFARKAFDPKFNPQQGYEKIANTLLSLSSILDRQGDKGFKPDQLAKIRYAILKAVTGHNYAFAKKADDMFNQYKGRDEELNRKAQLAYSIVRSLDRIRDIVTQQKFYVRDLAVALEDLALHDLGNRLWKEGLRDDTIYLR